LRELQQFWQSCFYLSELEEARCGPVSSAQQLHACDKHALVLGLWRDHPSNARVVRLVASLLLDFDGFGHGGAGGAGGAGEASGHGGGGAGRGEGGGGGETSDADTAALWLAVLRRMQQHGDWRRLLFSELPQTASLRALRPYAAELAPLWQQVLMHPLEELAASARGGRQHRHSGGGGGGGGGGGSGGGGQQRREREQEVLQQVVGLLYQCPFAALLDVGAFVGAFLALGRPHWRLAVRCALAVPGPDARAEAVRRLLRAAGPGGGECAGAGGQQQEEEEEEGGAAAAAVPMAVLVLEELQGAGLGLGLATDADAAPDAAAAAAGAGIGMDDGSAAARGSANGSANGSTNESPLANEAEAGGGGDPFLAQVCVQQRLSDGSLTALSRLSNGSLTAL
jgi:hypothetical protein